MTSNSEGASAESCAIDSASKRPKARAAPWTRPYLSAWMADLIRSSYGPYATARTNGGGARRQLRQRSGDGIFVSEVLAKEAGASSESPQRAQRGPLRAGISIQQASQIGTEERCGIEEPQREHEAGRMTQPRESMGLRSTRATARQREVSDSGPSIVSEP